MRTGLTISGTGHAALLLWSVLAFTARPHDVQSTEALPIDVISSSEFSQITKGAENAPPTPQPKPVAEKVAESIPIDDPTAKIGKKEVKAATDVQSPPETKPPAPVKKPAQAQSDPIADELKKEENKKPDQAKAEVKPTPAPKKPVQPTPPSYDPRKVAALLDKHDPQRLAAAGDTLSSAPSFGTAHGDSAVLSESEIDALRARLAQLWNPPAGAKDPKELTLDVEFKLKPDGTLDGGPLVLTSGRSALFEVARERAVIAVLRGQPYTMLKPEHYDQWRDLIVTFDPIHMLGADGSPQ